MNRYIFACLWSWHILCIWIQWETFHVLFLEIPDTFRKVNTFIVISWYILVFNESQTSHIETQSSEYHRCLMYIIHLNSDPNPDSSPYQGILIIPPSKHILMPFLFSINLPDIMTFMNWSFIKFNSYLPVLKPQADTSFV